MGGRSLAAIQLNNLILVWLFVLPFFVAGCAALFPRLSLRFHSEEEKAAMAWAPFSLGALASLMGLGLTVALLPTALSGAPVSVDYWWTRNLYHFRLQADSLSLMAALAICGLGFALHLHIVGLRETGQRHGASHSETPASAAPNPEGSYRAACLLLAQGCGIGAALSADLILVVFFLQLTLICLWLFVSASSRQQHLRLFAVAHIGGLLVLGGALLMWQRANDTSLQAQPLLLLSADPSTLKLTSTLVATLLTIVGGALALRLLPGTLLLPGVPVFAGLSLVLGLFSLWWGALRAWLARDLRGFATWLTVAQSGYLLIALAGAASPTAPTALLQAAALQILLAPLGIAAVWSAVSCVATRAGTDALPGLSGLFRTMPIAGIALLAGGLSLAGVPPLAGFHVQHLLIAGLVGNGRWALAAATVLVDLLMVAAVLSAFRQAFLRSEPPPRVAPASGWLSLQLLVLVAALLAAGIWPGPLTRWSDVILRTALSMSP